MLLLLMNFWIYLSKIHEYSKTKKDSFHILRNNLFNISTIIVLDQFLHNYFIFILDCIKLFSVLSF
jgi:hypothetical protein